MTTRRSLYLALGCVATLALGCASSRGLGGRAGAPGPWARKKVIQYGESDAPSPEFVREHVRRMEERPFDGVVIRMPKHQFIFDKAPWNAADLKDDRDNLAATQWRKFTDNFMFLNGSDPGEQMDWFNDAQWDVILANMKLFSQVLRDGKLAGVCFDAEPYSKLPEGAGANPWIYPGKYKGEQAGRVPAQARLRGRQAMAALQSAAPAVRILNFHQLARLLYSMGPNDQKWVDYKTPPNTAGIPNFHHQGHKYALLGEFTMGMLEAANPGSLLIDGNEHAYYYTEREEWEKGRATIREGARSLVPPELWAKYGKQAQVGAPVFPNWILGDWPHEKLGYIPPDFMTRYEQLRYLESQMYYALTSSDEYVWFYNEHMDFWRPKPETGKDRLPDGVEDTIFSARAKYEAGQPLGYDISGVVRLARDRLILEGKPPGAPDVVKPAH